MPTIMATAAVVGGGLTAFGQFSQGQETQKQQEYNAKIAEEEAGNIRAGADREVSIIGSNAVLNEYRQRKQQQAVTGSQVSGYAGRGVSVSTGSPLDVMADSIANSELEIAIGQWNAQNQIDITKFNAETGARRKESEATMRRKYGKSAATNALLKAGGTLLSTGGTAFNRFGKERATTPTKQTIG